jgi:hypothetical protein
MQSDTTLDRKFVYGAIGVVITLGGVGIRCVKLDAQPLWHDEIHSLALVRGLDLYTFPGSDIHRLSAEGSAGQLVQEMSEDHFWAHLSRNLIHEGHPPIYYFLLRAWCECAGFASVGVRSLSVVASVGVIVLCLIVLPRLFDRRLALIAAALVAVAPFQVFFATEARSYALLILLAAGFLLFVLEASLAKHRIGVLAISCACLTALLACLTHYYAVLFVVAVIACHWKGVIHAWRSQVALPAIVCAIVLSSWVPFLVKQLDTHDGSHWTEGAPSVVDVLEGGASTASDLLTGPYGSATSLERLLICVAAALTMLYGCLRLSEERRDLVRTLLATYVVCQCLVVCLDYVTDHHTILVPRYSAATHLLLVIALSISIRGLPTKLGVCVLLLFVCQGSFASWKCVSGERAPKQAFGDAAYFVSSRGVQGDLVVVVPPGPSLVGLSAFLDPSQRVMAAESHTLDHVLATNSDRDVWVVIQRLGATYMYAQDPPEESDQWKVGATMTRFVGLDVWHIGTDAQ